MKKVYTAQHPTEAHIVKGILETKGISCRVRGEVLFSARGEIPLTDETAPSVWIVEDFRYDEARRVVLQYEKNITCQSQDRKTWKCSSCGEVSEEQFTHCWKCGSAR